MQGTDRIRSKVGWLVGVITLITVGTLVAGRPPVDIPGSSWDTVGLGKSKVQGEGTLKGPAWVEVYFGAQAGLAADEFLAIIDDGSTEFYVVGEYYEKKPGKLAPLELDWSALEDELDTLFGDIGDLGFNIEIMKSKAKAKAKNSARYGEQVKFKFKVKFLVEFLGETAKVSLKTKTIGGRM